jgi:hypothetical protein
MNKRSIIFGAALLVPALGACGPKVASVSVEPSMSTLSTKDQVAALRATALDKDGKPIPELTAKIVWSSNTPAIATVDATGQVRAVKSGDVTIQATVAEIVGGAQVKVSIPSTLTVLPGKVSLVGLRSTAPLTAKVMDDAGRELAGQSLQWLSSDTNVVTVTDGTVTAVGAGAATVKALLGELNASVEIEVAFPKVAQLALEPSALAFDKAGDAVRVRALPTDGEGHPIEGLLPKFTTADPAIATVSAEGQVLAVKKGKTKLKAEADGQVVEIDVVVK